MEEGSRHTLRTMGSWRILSVEAGGRMDVARFRFLSPASPGSVAVRLRVAALAGVRIPEPAPSPLSFKEALEVARAVADVVRDALEPGLGKGIEDMSMDEKLAVHHPLALTTAIPEDVCVHC